MSDPFGDLGDLILRHLGPQVEVSSTGRGKSYTGKKRESAQL